MSRTRASIALAVLSLCALPAMAQSFRVQCPSSTITHPDASTTSDVGGPPNGNPYNGNPYTGPTAVPFMTISSIAESGSTVTVTASGGGLFPGLVSGLNVGIASVTPAGFNGEFPITVTSTPTVTNNITTVTFTYTAALSGLGTGTGGYVSSNENGGIKCQQISGGDGYSTMADGTQTFMFSFGPLSGLADTAAGHPSSQPPSVFNVPYPGCTTDLNPADPSYGKLNCPTPLVRGDPATTDGATLGSSPGNGGTAAAKFTWNGAVGLTPDVAQTVTVANLVEGPITPALYPGTTVPGCPTTTASANTVTAWTDTPSGFVVGQQVQISSVTAEGGTITPPGYAGAWQVTCVASNPQGQPISGMSPDGIVEYPFQYVATTAGLASDTGNDLAATASTPPALDGHVDPRPIIDVGVMNGNIPAPLSQLDEDDEFFLTLTNVGMIMRPDLFEQHTVHFHGYPNASSFYDGVPDASVAINIGASFTYYYLAPDAGTYFWHCHITPPEHLQMGMVGQVHVRPRQDRVPLGTDLYTALGWQNGVVPGAGTTALPPGSLVTAPPVPAPATAPIDPRTVCNTGADILCSATMPAVYTAATEGTDKLGNAQRYTYNDGDASTAYDVEYPLQMHGFDPNFHFVGMTFNPEIFVDMKDKYFLLNGRSYPDTIAAGPQASMSSDGQLHYSQPMPAIINIPAGGKALLRMVNLSVSEYHTLQSLGVPMKEVGFMAKLLRDQAGRNTEYYTNSITLGGGESLDVILDASDAGCGSTGCAAKLYPAGSVFYLYSPQLDHLSNDAENFGGLMTEVHICNSVTGGNTYGNTCN